MISDHKMRQLQQEAAEAGDDMQWLVCERALNEDFDYEDYSGGGHQLNSSQEKLIRKMTQDEARLMCEATIDTGRRHVGDRHGRD